MRKSIKEVIFIAILLNMTTSIKPIDYRNASKKITGLYQLMKDTHELLNKHKIVYWAAGGTLLGAVRHKGIIPLDVDLDIFIDNSSESLLLSIKSEIIKLGYKLIKKRNFVYKIENTKLDIHCDVILTYQKDNLIFYSCPKLKRRYRRDNLPLFFKAEELFPLQKYDFGIFKIIGPNKPNPYLKAAYGGNCLKQAVANVYFLNNYPALPVEPLEERVK
ncbi:LicD family protein [bacterium]|nr:LicD family protein [bacterium]